MKQKKRPINLPVIIIVVLVIAAAVYFIWGRSSSDTIELTPQDIALAKLETESQGPLDLLFYDGLPAFVGMNVKVQGADPAERAQNFMETYKDLYLQNDPDLALGIKRVDGDDVTIYQMYKGVLVYGGEMVVRLDDEIVYMTVATWFLI